MARLNLTLDDDTLKALNRYARSEKKPAAAIARRMLRESIAGEERRERERRLALDYAAGRADLAELEGLEAAQVELPDDE